MTGREVRSSPSARHLGAFVPGVLAAKWGVVVLIAVLGGCAGEEPGVVAARQRVLLASEPTAATTIADAQASVADRNEVVVIGKIADGADEVFVSGRASFLIRDLLPDELQPGSANHDASQCPFCQRKLAEAARAAVQVVDDQGESLAIDARKLLAVRPGDTVVVRGRAEWLAALNLLQVTASGIYVRPKEGRP